MKPTTEWWVLVDSALPSVVYWLDAGYALLDGDFYTSDRWQCTSVDGNGDVVQSSIITEPGSWLADRCRVITPQGELLS